MSGSLQVRGDLGRWVATTPNNSLTISLSKFSYSLWVEFISFAGTGNNIIFGTTSGQTFLVQANGFSQIAAFLHGANSVQQYGYPIPFGVSTHIAATLNATGVSKIYINGLVVSTASNIGITNATATGIMAGWGSAVSSNFLMSDAAIWSGVELSAADIINLRDRSVTPAGTSTPASSWWTLQGTASSNPVASTAGLADQIGSNHFTTIPGSSGSTTNAIYSATNLVYVAPVTVTAAYVARGGMLFFMMGTNPLSGSVTPVYPTTVAGNPTVLKNGSPVSLQGPFWPSVTHNDPWVAYQVVGGVLSTDVITWSTPDAWIVTSLGNAKDDAGTATNYVGSYEPGMYTYLDFDLPPSSKTLKNGWNGPSNVTSEVTAIKNVVHRVASPKSASGFSWSNITSYDATTGYPLQIGSGFSGVSTGPFWSTADNNGINPATGFPLPVPGIWTIFGDETVPGNPLIIGMKASAALDISGPVITHGPVLGGIEYNKRFDFTLSYHDSPPTSFNVGLSITAQTPGHGAGAFSLTNIRAFEAGNAPTISPENVINDNVARMLTASPGVHVPIMRFMEALTGSDGAGNVIYGADYPPNNRFGYSGDPVIPWTGAGNWPTNNPNFTGNRELPIHSVRKYDVGVSPNVYASQNYARTIASDIPQYPWMWTLGSLSPAMGYDWVINLSSGIFSTGTCVVEVVVGDTLGNPIPHNLQTGQLILMPASGTTTVGVTNPTGGTGTISIAKYPGTVVVTGASTFVFITGSPNLPQTTGLGFVDSSGPYIQNVVATVRGTLGVAPTIEDVGHTATTLGNAIWIAVSHATNDDGVTAFATRLYNSTPRGTKIYVQYSNEIFIGNFQFGWMSQISSIEGLKLGEAIVLRTGEIHAIFTSVWGADSGSIVKVFQPFINTPGPTADALAYARLHHIPIDAVATAIYMSMDTSPTFVMAAASICINEQIAISGTPTHVSVAHPDNDRGSGISSVLSLVVPGTVMPMESYQDLCRHHIKYNKTLNGPTGALPVFIGQLHASGYGLDNGDGWTYPFPKIIGYECAWSAAIPPGVSKQMAVVRSGLSHDFQYHPSMYDTSTAFLQHMQQPGPTGTPGFDTVCIESLTGLRNAGTGATTDDGSDGAFVELWGSYVWQGQQTGVAPFTGQQYWSSDLGGNGAPHDFDNVSVNGRAYLDWINDTGGGMTPSASMGVTERHDVMAAAGAIASSASMGVTERHDAMAAIGHGPPKGVMALVGHSDLMVALASTDLSPLITKVSPSRIPQNRTTTLTLVGVGTAWTSGSTISVTNSITGTTTVTKGTWTQISATMATLSVTAGSGYGTWKLTIDGLDSPTIGVGSLSKWFGGMNRLIRP